ncbi:methyltransferase, partial [Oryctes borbonicus]
MLKKTSQSFISKSKYLISNSGRFSSTTTIDDREIKHFQQQSQQWWDQEDANPLYTMSALRIPFIRDGLISTGITNTKFHNSSFPLTDLNILDVGCGGGYVSEPLARLGCKVVGIDATDDLINVAQERAKRDTTLSNLTYKATTIEEFSPENLAAFDAVVASEVIEHVNDQARFVSECVKCLKPEGSIFLTTVNKTPASRLFVICIAEAIGTVPKGTHDYDKFIAPHTLQRLLENDNCHTKMIHGMFYNFFTNKWSWIRDTS